MGPSQIRDNSPEQVVEPKDHGLSISVVLYTGIILHNNKLRRVVCCACAIRDHIMT